MDNVREMRVVAVIQARLSSRRLPGKSLADVAGKPLLARVLAQVMAASKLDEVVVATSDDATDDAIADYVNSAGATLVRGPLDDVLARYALAAEKSQADIIVRLTGDCPLLSPDTVDEVVSAFLDQQADYACNTEPYSRPEGQDVEVMTVKALTEAHVNATLPMDREHVTPWIKRNKKFRAIHHRHADCDYGLLRWSVDHQDDLDFAKAIWSELQAIGDGPYDFSAIISTVLNSTAKQGEAILNEGFYISIMDQVASEKAVPLCLDKSFEWLERSNAVIPAGAQTYSKSWRHHIRGVTPIFLESGDGSTVTDVDGNIFVDLIQGLLPNILGYAHKEVDGAAHAQANRGHSFSLAHPLEVQLAEKLCDLIPCAEMVRFGKNGSDATAGAVRVSRAFTERDRVAVCGYHGWQDWYIGSTSRNAGVPKAVQDLTHPFEYGKIESLKALLESHPGEFAAVVMEPVNFDWPEEGYLQAVKELTHQHGALLIFDEICSGFHFGLGGAQKILDVTPDLATFGKAMGNGWPISCIVGRRDVMQIFEDAFVSFTFAGDVSAMAAAIKVIDILENTDAYSRMSAAGNKLFDGARVMAQNAGLGDHFRVKGHPHWAVFNYVDDDGNPDPATTALWLQEVTRRGVLILTTFNISATMDEDQVMIILSAFAGGFKLVAEAKAQGVNPIEWLDGPVPVPAFRAR